MKDERITRELYISAFDKVRASDELMRKVESMKNEEVKGGSRRSSVPRRMAVAAAVLAALFVLSNIAALAASGETWVQKLFWYDEKPDQPMDNVRRIFFENGSKLSPDDPGAAKQDYYGGTYVENGVQVILLTDLSHADEFTGVGEDIRFEKCDYAYSELTEAIETVSERLGPLWKRGEGFARDIAELGLNDKENRIHVSILHISGEKIQWFRDNLYDADFLIFDDTDTLPQLD